MSLYNNVAESLSSQGLLGSIRSGLNAGMGLVNKYIPIQAQRAINVGAGAVGDLMNGDWNSAGLRLLDSGLLNELLPGFGGGVASQVAYWGAATPLLGGISPREAKRIYDQVRGERLAKKNLWLLEVTSALNNGGMNMPDRFNLFATEVEYSPFIIAGDKRRVGGAVADAVQGAEPIELRMTTLDDQAGSLKMWFEHHAAAVAARDGTVGVPANYAIRIKLVHSFITPESNRGGYQSIGLFRPDQPRREPFPPRRRLAGVGDGLFAARHLHDALTRRSHADQ